MMAGHLTPLAQAVRTAAESSSALSDAARALLEAAGPDDGMYRVVDAGAHLWIVLIPGFGPLSEPADHVALAPQIS